MLGGSRGFDVPSDGVVSEMSPSLAGLHLGASAPPPNFEEVFRREAATHAARVSDLRIYLVTSARAERIGPGRSLSRELDAVSAFLLGSVKRLVGVREQAFEALLRPLLAGSDSQA